MARVLIVEDEMQSLTALEALVRGEGHEVSAATSLRQARSVLASLPIDLVLADVGLPDGRGFELVKENGDNFELVIVTGDTALETAVEALRLGAIDFLPKPIDHGRLKALLANFERTAGLRSEIEELREQLRDMGRFGALVGTSKPMLEIYDLIEKVADSEASVFVTGESGTGKELVAQTIHQSSRRAESCFLPLNCGAVSPGLIESELFGHERGAFTGADRRRAGYFERADRGTLFLDEITEMPAELQVRLLRVLETGELRRVGGTDAVPVDVRIIAASNRDPRVAVEEGKLREDLYYRLRVFPIDLPTLRERGADDVRLLAQAFLARLNKRYGDYKEWTEEALEVLQRYPWPGNVRELKNCVERTYILSGKRMTAEVLPVEVRTLSPDPADSGPYLRVKVGSSLDEIERRVILATLERMGGRRNDTAEALGISQKTLYNRLKKYEQEMPFAIQPHGGRVRS